MAERGNQMDRRIALLCSGLGRVNRGYERFTVELFRIAQTKISITLFTGGSTNQDREVVVGGWGRDDRVCIALERFWKDRFFWESASFGVKAWPKLLSGGFHVIHYSQPSLNSVFSRLELLRNRQQRRLFSHALNMGAEHCLRCHHIHQVSPVAYENALDIGVPENRMTLLPYGLYTDQFVPVDVDEKKRMKEVYGVPGEIPVIVTVAALNRHHKRIDLLIRTVSRLPLKCFLILCGKVEDRIILDDAARLLGERFVHLYVAAEKVKEIYSMADLFVLSSTIEGFGLVVLEAALSGIPVLVHDSKHFRWLLGPHWHNLVDMGNEEAVAQAIVQCLNERETLAERMSTLRGELVGRFDWGNLMPAYVQMYQRVQEGPTVTISREMGNRL